MISTWALDLNRAGFTETDATPAANSERQERSLSISREECSDEELLSFIGANDHAALSVLFHRHAKTVKSVGFRILRDEGEADDLLQEVFLYIFHHARVFDASKGGAKSWIVQMAYHRAFDRRRYLNARRFYAYEILEDDLIQENGGDAESALISEITGQALLHRFRETLTPEQCCTLELFFFKGNTLREIAEETGLSLGSVRHHYYRGLERLRTLLLSPK